VSGCALIVATGMQYRHLLWDRLEQLEGAGVYCSVAEDGARYCRNTNVVVTGGGNGSFVVIYQFSSRCLRRARGFGKMCGPRGGEGSVVISDVRSDINA